MLQAGVWCEWFPRWALGLQCLCHAPLWHDEPGVFSLKPVVASLFPLRGAMGFDFCAAPGGVIPERGVSSALGVCPCRQATSLGVCLRLGSFNVIVSSFVFPEELLNNFAQQIGAWRFCLYFLSSTRNDYVMMYSLTVFEVRRAPPPAAGAVSGASPCPSAAREEAGRERRPRAARGARGLCCSRREMSGRRERGTVAPCRQLEELLCWHLSGQIPCGLRGRPRFLRLLLHCCSGQPRACAEPVAALRAAVLEGSQSCSAPSDGSWWRLMLWSSVPAA